LIVKQLKLVNYRNFSDIELNFSDKYNVFYGDNAQGKTNIIESVFFCASGRSHRASRDNELVKIGENNFYIKIEIENGDYDCTIEIGYDRKNKKIKINQNPIRKLADLMGHLKAVFFSPEDLSILKAGPSERRRFIDITLSQLKPVYFYNLQQYYKVLAQRNNLLKKAQGRKDLLDTLDIWNENLATIGSNIILERNKFINTLYHYTMENHEKLTNRHEKLEVRYSPSIKAGEYNDLNDIKKQFHKQLEKLKNSEILSGVTLCGPQRDDLDILLNGNNIKIYGSQGQQRTAVLSMKLATIDVIEKETGKKPILLLDDVMSELDEKRRRYLYENMDNVQTFITTTDRNLVEDSVLANGKIFRVENGTVTED